MSKKLSQSEIDALVASLLTGDAPADEAKTEPGETVEPEVIFAQGATPDLGVPVVPSGPAPMAAAAAVGLAPADTPVVPPPDLPFDQVQDLGLVTQEEVDRALAKNAAFRRQAETATATATVPTPPPAAQVAASVAAAPVHTAMPPSNASYAASQAQAVQQTRKALGMAALRGVLLDIDLTVTVELGKARLKLSDVLNLGPGSVVTLDKQANQPVDVLVNRLPLMKADILAIGEKYGVRLTGTSLNVKAAS